MAEIIYFVQMCGGVADTVRAAPRLMTAKTEYIGGG